MAASLVRLMLAAQLAIALVALAGCSLLGSNASETPRLVDNVLVSIDAHGGHCVVGECSTVTTIRRDGRLTVDGNGVDPVADAVDPSLLAVLAAAVDVADYARVTAVPFSGECPTAFDGQELTYTFHPAERAVAMFSSCEVQIDPNHPLFRALDAVILQIAP